MIATEVAYERAAPAADVGKLFADRGARVRVEPDLEKALALARALTPEGGVTVCAGSLYLAGDVRNLLVRDDGSI